MKKLALVVTISTSLNAQALTTYNDNCLDSVTNHSLHELEAFGHSVTVQRCYGNFITKHSKKKQRRSLMMKMYRYDNKNNFVRVYKSYLNNLGLYIGYSTTPYWK